MKKRDDIKAIVAAALIVYSVFTVLAAERRLAAADALRSELRLEADALNFKVADLRTRLANPPSDELMERLARERLGLIRQGEIIFYFGGS